MDPVIRPYVSYRSDPVSIMITQHGRVLRCYKDERRFPFVTVANNSPVPRYSLLFRKTHHQGSPSNIDETDAGVWIEVQRGKRAPILYEQVHVQQQGFALIMLSLEQSNEEEEDRDAERTAKERYRERQARWRE